MNEKTINLVDKLREYAVEPGRYWLDNYALQAGHEIERLRRQVELLETQNRQWEEAHNKLQKELEVRHG
jgi:hypothetical protein